MPAPAVLVNVAEIFALMSFVELIALATSCTEVTLLKSIIVFTLELKLSVINILPALVKSATVMLAVETAYGFKNVVVIFAVSNCAATTVTEGLMV